HPASYYMQSAAGRTSAGGQAFGGVAMVNGAPAVIPPWLNQALVPQVLMSLGKGLAAGHGDGPVSKNGQHLSATRFAQLQLVPRANGTYWLVDPSTGQLAKRANGSVFTLDLDLSRDSLAASVPGSVLR